jgi:hypothetical protein
MIRSQAGQRVLGLVFLIGGAFGTWWVWDVALTQGYYYTKFAILPPALGVAGLGILLFPIDYEWLMSEHGVDQPRSFHHYPLPLKIFLVLALVAGGLNWYLLSHQ